MILRYDLILGKVYDARIRFKGRGEEQTVTREE